MIIVCSECQAQYSVPDAKVRGRKVRVTCKHCGFGIIVDGFALDAPPPPPPPKPTPLEAVPAIFDALSVAEDDATRVMRRPRDFSVHDEPTVVGRIPLEALEAERRFAQRTVPPPPGEADSAPESDAADSDPAPISLQAISTRPLEQDVAEPAVDSGKADSAREAAASSPAPTEELARAEPPPPPVWPWVLGAILIVVVLAALAIRH